MNLLPAIDLLDGRVVRLKQGAREAVTFFEEPPLAWLERFAEQGATRVHLVDLSGAFAGVPTQRDALASLLERAQSLGLSPQVGGGLRDAQAARDMLQAGAARVVVGTLAVRHPEHVRALCEAHPESVVVAVDAKDGKVATQGWQATEELTPATLGRHAASWGAAGLLYTDVSRDGMGTGPDIAGTLALQAHAGCPVIASGGVHALADIAACVQAGVHALIVGRALLAGHFTLSEALATCSSDASSRA